MDTLIVAEKLESLGRCLARIEQKCPASASLLAADPDAQDIVVLNLSRAVQLCVDMCEVFATRFLADFRRFAGEVSRSSGLASAVSNRSR